MSLTFYEHPSSWNQCHPLQPPCNSYTLSSFWSWIFAQVSHREHASHKHSMVLLAPASNQKMPAHVQRIWAKTPLLCIWKWYYFSFYTSIIQFSLHLVHAIYVLWMHLVNWRTANILLIKVCRPFRVIRWITALLISLLIF